MTPRTLSSRLVPQPPSLSPFVPPTRIDWDTLFQPLFDEYFNPPPCVDHPVLEVAAPEPTSYKEELTKSCWIEAMQEELNEFECLEVWELVPRPDRKFSKGTVDPTLFIIREGKDILLVQIYVDDIIFASTKPDLCEKISEVIPKGIFLNQSKFTLESLKKYGMETLRPSGYSQVEKSKLDEDPQGKAVDPTRYRRMIGTLMYLTSSRPDLLLQTLIMLVLGDRLVSWSSKKQKSIAISSTKAKCIALYHFIKEQVENGVVELYFVKIEYQLADIFTKALGRERLAFLIYKLGMKSMPPKTLKRLAEEEEE
ncbi:hypothetical protein Tco_0993148 [Tanacetum coccineum]|uniref:Reverse transcriptase Ty1/copia-type domain-containing protein n=1 Tax=Tanacetum coccineum TaxID=301880 RepID=A0ABQ5F4M2_9ASTR